MSVAILVLAFLVGVDAARSIPSKDAWPQHFAVVGLAAIAAALHALERGWL